MKEDSTSGALSPRQCQTDSMLTVQNHRQHSKDTRENALYNATGLQTGNYIYLIGLVCEEKGENPDRTKLDTTRLSSVTHYRRILIPNYHSLSERAGLKWF